MISRFSPKLKALFALHTAVFLWGFTAILGKLITTGSIALVWQRMTITATVYLCLPVVWKQLKKISLKSFITFSAIGVLVLAHWITFYGSIKLGNSVSITLACLGSASFFAALIEPLLLKQQLSKRNLLMGLIVVLGILIIYLSLPSRSQHSMNQTTNYNYTLAIITGLISAALAATFTSLNKKFIDNEHPLTISVVEMFAGASVLTIYFSMQNPDYLTFPTIEFSQMNWQNLSVGPWDWLWIALLSVVCTNLTFYLGTYALKELSAFTSNLTVNLEPIYGIILGAVFFKENQQLGIGFYTGALIILTAIFTQAYFSAKDSTQ